jgi:hypothetical protein
MIPVGLLIRLVIVGIRLLVALERHHHVHKEATMSEDIRAVIGRRSVRLSALTMEGALFLDEGGEVRGGVLVLSRGDYRNFVRAAFEVGLVIDVVRTPRAVEIDTLERMLTLTKEDH